MSVCFRNIIRNIFAYLIKMMYLCSIKTLKSIKTNKQQKYEDYSD